MRRVNLHKIFLFGLACAIPALAGDQLLFDFSRDAIPTNIAPTDAQMAQTNGALCVATGHHHKWPGITMPDCRWDLAAFAQVAVRVKNLGTNKVAVSCRLDGGKGSVTGAVTLAPGQSDTLKVTLKRTADNKLDGKLFGMRGYPVAPAAFDPKNVTRLLVFVSKPAADHVFAITDITATGAYTPPTAWISDAEPFLPFIDTFGQYKHKDWPGKTHSLADLAAKREQETRDLAANPGPQNWDKYGGWATGPQREATGFFRTEKVNGKWWLIDPDGRLFFSHGIDCVRMTDATPVEERANWFADFPGDQPEFQEFFSKLFALKGHYAGRHPRCFSFGGANLRRKYGADWKTTYRNLIHQRLRSWGLNTIANWSEDATCRLRRTPYTDTIGSRNAPTIEGSEGYWAKFPDVFDPAFAAGLRRAMATKQNQSAGDPWCLGYFCDNEMSWGDDLSLALATLKSPATQAAKKVFIDDLKAKYSDIAKLNAAWGTTNASWDALLESRTAPDKQKAGDDLGAFYTHIAEQYFRTVRDTIKAVAPHQLYLGCRFSANNPRAAAAAAKYCDVVSYNLYRRSVADFQFNGGGDVPLIIGEFHFGSLDRGLFHTGLVPVANQAARAQAYEDYVRGALRHPQFVGTHWFQYKDESTTGRNHDEENYQIGFVDIADTPYPETIAASRAVGADLYH